MCTRGAVHLCLAAWALCCLAQASVPSGQPYGWLVLNNTTRNFTVQPQYPVQAPPAQPGPLLYPAVPAQPVYHAPPQPPHPPQPQYVVPVHSAQALYPVLQPVLTPSYTNTTSNNNRTNRKGYHDLLLGSRVRGDSLIYHTNVRKDSSLWRKTIKEVCAPPAGSNMRATITMVEVLDRSRRGEGAGVTVTGGGVGQGRVCFRFKSARNEDIDHEVNIYGW